MTEDSLTQFMCSNPSLKPETISRVSIPMSREEEGMARGIAFVSFTTVNALLQCVAMDGDLLGDRNVKVKRAEQRKKQAPPPGRGGGNGRAEQEGGVEEGVMMMMMQRRKASSLVIVAGVHVGRSRVASGPAVGRQAAGNGHRLKHPDRRKGLCHGRFRAV